MRGLKEIRDFLLPVCCVLCAEAVRESGFPICADCLPEFYRLLSERCGGCKKTISHCSCEPKIPGLVNLFYYGSKSAGRILGYIKNNADMRTIRFFATLLAERSEDSYDALTYVPRRKKGIRHTGYDQAKLIAAEMADILGVECISTLERKGQGEQKKLQSAIQRRKEAENSYTMLRDYPSIEGKKLLLIDDICTTGSTVSVCRELLKKAGAQKVSVAVLAVTREKNH